MKTNRNMNMNMKGNMSWTHNVVKLYMIIITYNSEKITNDMKDMNE